MFRTLTNDWIVSTKHNLRVRYNVWERFVQWLRRRDEARRSRRALDWLSDGELRDVGLTRDRQSGAYRRSRFVGDNR